MKPETQPRYHYASLRNRLRYLQERYWMTDTLRQIVQNEIDAACQYWFEQGGGKAKTFEKKYNGK